MLKDKNYQEKFSLLDPWFKEIIDSAKKELKQEHLSKDRAFQKRYLQGKPVIRATVDELVKAYSEAIQDGDETVAEIVSTRWILRNSEIYTFFVDRLQKINPQFDQIESLLDEDSNKLLSDAKNNFEIYRVYAFALFNAVAFSDEIYENLRKEALSELEKNTQEQSQKQSSDEELQNEKRTLLEMQRTIDKYEKKISGLQKKYIQDMDGLKKQIATLHKKLAATK
ncbi:MAG: hypothetical protein JHC93_01150 [Parachlamydiales bacterium]|nr:hypothetical protein [Parachlamydiales bacterium]